jgi:Uncharacterised protein family UPF0547
MEILILMFWLALCAVAAYIASNKGRSGVGIFLLSVFLSPLVGVIVALAMSPNLAAQGKKKCPSCAEFVQPDAKVCRFCQHSFVEEEAAERSSREEERARREEVLAAARARQQAEYAAWQAKPWWRRNLDLLIFGAIAAAFVGGFFGYIITHPETLKSTVSTASPKSEPTVPEWVMQERSSVPKSIWEKKVQWAVQHHCYFSAMSQDEVVRALGKPAEETADNLTYKRPTEDCVRYDGDVCAEYKTEQQIVFLKDGYEDKQLNDSGESCLTLYGEHHYVGLQVPDFRRLEEERRRAAAQEAAALKAAEDTKERAEAQQAALAKECTQYSTEDVYGIVEEKYPAPPQECWEILPWATGFKYSDVIAWRDACGNKALDIADQPGCNTQQGILTHLVHQ